MAARLGLHRIPLEPAGSDDAAIVRRSRLSILGRWLGTYAVSGLVIPVGRGLAHRALRQKIDWRGAVLLFGPAALMLLPTAGEQQEGALAYTLVQPDARQEELHDSSRYEAMFQRGMGLSRADRPGQTRLVLWPESALPDYLLPGYPQAYYDARPMAAARAIAGTDRATAWPRLHLADWK